MAKSDPQPDVLVLGDHPAAYLAAALVRHKAAKIRVLHATIPHQAEPDRLVIINPAFFGLHPLLEPLRRKLDLTAVYGIQFLSDDPAVRSEHRSKAALAYTISFKAIRSAVADVAAKEGVEFVTPKAMEVHRLDETGVAVHVGKGDLHAKVMVLAGRLPESQERRIGIPDSWGPDIVHRYTFLKLAGAKWADMGSRPTIPMSLNLRDMLCWGWMLPGPKGVQLAVEQPVETLDRARPAEMLAHWADVLRRNGLLSVKGDLPLDSAESMDLPLAGALAHEGVASRTLLVGPAGGFYSASAEDIYPNCWSAVYAADTVKKALKEPHLQDALQPYRHKWRTTLGDYLRGPQQNFRFLLPLVFRKQPMTTRLTEAILLGKSVVR